MDWENKHFSQETVLHATPEVVVEAARRFVGQSLPDWSVTWTDDGFEANGQSAAHKAHAIVRFSAVPEGTKIAVELAVQRRSLFGFMLVDVGGYYDGLLRKWLWALWKLVGEAHAGQTWMDAPHGTKEPNASVGARVVVMDAFGKAWLGEVREVSAAGVRVAYDEGVEKWVPATAVHVVERRENLAPKG